jgi:hypothetical protein
MTIVFILLVMAFICFICAAAGIPAGRVSLLGVGLALWVLTLLIGGHA